MEQIYRKILESRMRYLKKAHKYSFYGLFPSDEDNFYPSRTSINLSGAEDRISSQASKLLLKIFILIIKERKRESLDSVIKTYVFKRKDVNINTGKFPQIIKELIDEDIIIRLSSQKYIFNPFVYNAFSMRQRKELQHTLMHLLSRDIDVTTSPL